MKKEKILKTIKAIASKWSYVAIGLLIGWFVFGGNSTKETAGTNKDEHANHSKDEIWTCSMHPQIRQTEAGDCPICGMDLIPLESGTDNDNPIQLVMTADAAKLAHIETIVVGEKNYDATNTAKELFLTGKVKMDETKGTSQSSHLDGRIENLLVRSTNESVRKGQKIATIYAPQLVNAQKELLEAVKMKEKYPELYAASREKIRQWKLPESTIDEIEKSGLIKKEVDIYAERSGLVMKRYVEEGDYIKMGMPLFDIMDLSRVWVLFDVYEKDLQWVNVGTSIEFNLEAMPEKTFHSKITFIDPIIDPRTRVAAARVEISNSGGYLKPDMFAKGIARMSSNAKQTNKSPKEIIVPKTAILWTGTRSVLYVKNQEMDVPTFEFREVVLGADLGQSYVVKEGVENGEEVVVNGAFRVDAAAQLSNKSSMMNRLVSIKKETNETAVPLPDFITKTSPEFRKQLAVLVEDYFKLKDDLVATDFENSKKAILVLETSFSKIDMMLLKGEAHEFWMKQVKDYTTNINGFKKAPNIDQQRMWFSGISTLLVNSVQVFGLPKGTVFVQHCPMALDNKGADWLSKEEQVLNPYFGSKMLKCGTVKNTLKY